MELSAALVGVVTLKNIKTDFALIVNKLLIMLKINLNSCNGCQDIRELLCEIDDKLHIYGQNYYNNITILTSLPFDKDVMDHLLHYKRILTKRLFNPNYASEVPFEYIISKVKILLNR